VVSEEDLDAELRETDILVMVLPSTDSTTKALDAHRLAQLPSRSIVVNVGRGSTVDEDALVDALQAGEIAGAAVDVASSEPLPSDARLWTAPNIVITPHVAGFRAYGGEQLVAGNVAALLAGRPGDMRNVVERG
jgi:phosphoglycerate dehydrogenase-like enzyme